MQKCVFRVYFHTWKNMWLGCFLCVHGRAWYPLLPFEWPPGLSTSAFEPHQIDVKHLHSTFVSPKVAFVLYDELNPDVNWSKIWIHFVWHINKGINRGGGHLYFRLDIILVKGLSKHNLNAYFSGMKIDPKYAFLHAFFLIWASCPFQNLSIWPKTYLFFQFCTFLHP